MRASKPRATPVREGDSALVRVHEATIEILKTENEILKRRLAVAETWAAQAVITKRCDASGVAHRATPETAEAERRDQLAAERARPWWRRLAG
jgi:hypothetical protein